MNPYLLAQRPLSLRECDCTRLVMRGLGSAEIAANLRISQSTVEKHLSSIRSKLGVSRTSEILLVLQNQNCLNPAMLEAAWSQLDLGSAKWSALGQFVSQVSTSRTFDEAWKCLGDYLGHRGFNDHVILGIVTEPFGYMSNGAKLLKSSFPSALMEFYEKAGGAANDPIPKQLILNRKEFFVDQAVLFGSLSAKLPDNVKDLAMAFMDVSQRGLLVLPGSDETTGAPYCISLDLNPQQAKELKSDDSGLMLELHYAVYYFWHSIKRSGLLVAFSGLTARQRQALSFAARGFTVSEIAEHMNVSTRSAEDVLAKARSNLGARNTSAAIFRAICYGALENPTFDSTAARL